jgi:toxin ParE1/3/4
VAFDVRVLSEAEDDLFEIYRYVAEHGGAERADGFDRRIRAACEKLADFPNRGTPRNPLEPGLRSIPFERRATIYYRVAEATVEIVRIVYRGRDADRLFTP